MILQEDKFELEFFIIVLLEDGTIVMARDINGSSEKAILCYGKKIEKVLDYCLGYEEARSSLEYYKNYYKDLSK